MLNKGLDKDDKKEGLFNKLVVYQLFNSFGFNEELNYYLSKIRSNTIIVWNK